jgi:hypothetical protein
MNYWQNKALECLSEIGKNYTWQYVSGVFIDTMYWGYGIIRNGQNGLLYFLKN